MTFKLFDVGAKAGHCHKSDVLEAFSVSFFVMATSNIANRTKVDSFLARLFCFFKLQKFVTGHYLVIFAARCWKFRGGHP